MRISLVLILAAGIPVAALHAGTVPQPCSGGANAENILPVSNGVTTYCVSDFGWSDTWLVGTPATYSQAVDMFSGDDAFNLYYNAPNGGVGSGVGWLSPSLDMGTLKPETVPSNWIVITAVHYTSASSAESVIGNADGLHITIDTTSLGSGVQISLKIQNTSLSPITGLVLSDYFNFHPNGSAEPNNLDGTTSMQNGCIVTTGSQQNDPSFLMNGFMCGVRAPDHYEVGLDSGLNPVWKDVQNVSYLNNSGPVGPASSAGALAWNLGTIAAGGEIDFAVGKNIIPTLSENGNTPEPASIYLAAGALSLLFFVRRKARR